MPDAAPRSLREQADLLDYMIRCARTDGVDARPHVVTMSRHDFADLEALRDRLLRMAPHEAAIKRVVVGR